MQVLEDVTINQLATIQEQAISLTSPVGGESWLVGSVQPITWVTTAGMGDLRLEYSTDGGASYATIVETTANDGSYDWTVPAAVSGSCVVRISDPVSGAQVTSKPFAITLTPAMQLSGTVAGAAGGGGQQVVLWSDQPLWVINREMLALLGGV